MEEILHQAELLEKKYDWIGASELYRTALSKVPEQNESKIAEIQELVGYSFFRAACQANSVDEFKKRMQMSLESYGKAAELFEKVEPARGLYCKAMARYSSSWFVEDPSKKKESLDGCWELLKETLASFDAAGNAVNYGKAFHDLYYCLLDRDSFSENWLDTKRMVEEFLKYSQTAIERLSQVGDIDELAWACILTSSVMVSYLDYFKEREEEFRSAISNYMKKAVALLEKTEDATIQFFLDFTLIWINLFIKGDVQVASEYAEKALTQSEKLNDHVWLGWTYFGLNFVASSKAITEEDPDKTREQHKLAIRFAEESIRHYLLVCRCDRAAFSHSVYLVDSYLHLAELETSLEEKRVLIGQAVDAGRKGAKYAQLSGHQSAKAYLCHSLSKAIFFFSNTKKNTDEKRKLLEESLKLREENIEIAEKLTPPNYWDQGIAQNYLALLKAELAKIESNEEKKKHLYEESVSSMEKCLEICTKSVQNDVAPTPKQFAILGWYHDWFGDILDQLHLLTRDESVINRAIEVYQDSAQVYQKAGMPSRVAEAYWQTARLYDRHGEYLKAASNFEQACKNYQLVAEKIPQLKDFCQIQALYMQAWSEIEKGKHHHARQEYGSAREHYEKAADIHRSLKKWSYLSPNYSAWAHVESAEDLSRKEQGEDAIRAFERAARLFAETKETLQVHLNKIEDADEKQMAIRMLEATGTRSEYCTGRIALEEAKILDKKGDHYSSSEKYGQAADTFKKITQALESEQDRKEFRLIATLSRAWQKMTQAEAETSPTLYIDAAQLFEEARELSPSERAKTLALGHSRFCRALEAGTKFADTRDPTSYAIAIQHLESAANYYLKAGFQSASEYAKATELLFDAYVHMDHAKKESDPEKKAKLYAMAEKVLQTSAGSFMKAEHPEKREQVLKLLEKVKEERELALSLSEVLHTPTIVSATTAFSTPNPTHESAVGLERFEHADIQANLITRQKELKVGESLNLEIELVNAGKGPALLTKITEIVPEGFELTEKPEMYRVEDSYLNMKGKRLDQLKMEEIKLVLKPKVQGVFPLKPKILYLDENGKYKSHEPEPITITVKELGIKGWLKGEK